MVQMSRSMVGLLVMVVGILVISYGVEGKSGIGDEIDRKLKLLNKPAVKSIQSEDGDIIDCVDIYKQPAFDHPALKNHVIQMRPSFSTNINKGSDDSTTATFQTWRKSGTCPDGTVPIRRIRREDLLRQASLDRFGTKPEALAGATFPRYVKFDNGTESKVGVYANRSTATLVTVGYNYLGAKAELNLWNPSVELETEFTTNQIWLKAGPGDKFESVESGWMVNPRLYGDSRSRFFALWTGDAYQSKGCFDLTCPGFMHIDPSISLGASIGPLSIKHGQQYNIAVEIKQDPDTRNWWLGYGGSVVGYWPWNLFGHLSHPAILVEWGGEVFSANVMKSPHTATYMGSGDFAAGIWGSACFVKHPRIMDNSLEWKYPEWVGVATNEPKCYSVLNYMENMAAEPVFFFGGPGRTNNPSCQ